MNATDSTMVCNKKVASAASRVDSFSSSNASPMVASNGNEGVTVLNERPASSTQPDKVTIESLLSSKSGSGATLKQKVRDKVGETLQKNNIGSRLAALSSASSVTMAAAALTANSGRSVASDPEIRPTLLVRSRSQQQDRSTQMSSHEFTKTLPQRCASARPSSSTAPDPDGRVLRDDAFYSGELSSGRTRLQVPEKIRTGSDKNRSISLSEHAIPSRQSPLPRNSFQTTATFPSRSAHARIPTSEGSTTVRGKAGSRRKEPPGASPYKSQLVTSPSKVENCVPSATPSPGTDTSDVAVETDATPTLLSKHCEAKQSAAYCGSGGSPRVPPSTGTIAVTLTQCATSPSRTSQLKKEISKANATISKLKKEISKTSANISSKSSPPPSASRSSMTPLAAHLARGGSPRPSSRTSAPSTQGDRPGRTRSRSRSRCRGSDAMSVASSCTQGSQSRRRVQRSVSRGRTGKPSQLAEAGASSAMPRRRKPPSSPPSSSSSQERDQAAQDCSNSSGGNNAIEYDFDDGADDLLLGRKPSSSKHKVAAAVDDDADSASVTSTTSWKPPPPRAKRRSHSLGRVSTKRFDEHGVSWGDTPSSSVPDKTTGPRSRSGGPSKARSHDLGRKSPPSPEIPRTERRRSLNFTDAQALRDELSTLETSDAIASKKRESKIDPTLLIKDIVEASTKPREGPSDASENTDKAPIRGGIKKTLSGMLRRRPSLSSTSSVSSSSASLSTAKSLASSVPSMFVQLLLQPSTKGSRGEPMRSPSTTSEQDKLTDPSLLPALSSASAPQALNQNSVTTHELSDESSSSPGE